ncbi:hypothetical protein RM6536_1336 [Rothia mucilaginosa]|uniref:Uncharacterized protein n=1 Tax=Rothia mucilaginosa TaxID=43675 RepID=A0A0K2S0H0_9MICC|nr:hypothetical protein RM6536_1336 [Rothia mucilaginosa]
MLSHSVVRGKTRARAHERRQRHRTPRQRGASRNNSPMRHGGLLTFLYEQRQTITS